MFSCVPEEYAQKLNQTKPTVTVKLSGDKLIVEIESPIIPLQKIEYILNKKVDEALYSVNLRVEYNSCMEQL